MATATKRTRLSPTARRNQILDVAKQLIASDGLQRFSLKLLASQAGISEPLLFHYFSSRLALLQQLLLRDYNLYLDSLNASLDEAETLQEVTRVFVARNYDHHDEDVVMDILLAEPDVAEVVQEMVANHSKGMRKLLVKLISEDLGMGKKDAAMMAIMGSAASIGAAKYAHEYGVPREKSIQMAMDFIEQGFDSRRVK